jgi:hypothetical protein
MFTDIKIKIENKPGTLALIGETLGNNGVNIEGFCGPCEKEGIARFLVSDLRSARSAFEKVGIKVVGENEVLVIDLDDKPGMLGKVCRRIADADINIDFFYAASNTRVALGVSDIEKAKSVL